MSDIWLATDSNHKPYALRRLHDKLRFNFAARRRFNRGAEILSKIHDHQGIIGYIEHGKISALSVGSEKIVSSAVSSVTSPEEKSPSLV